MGAQPLPSWRCCASIGPRRRPRSCAPVASGPTAAWRSRRVRRAGRPAQLTAGDGGRRPGRGRGGCRGAHPAGTARRSPGWRPVYTSRRWPICWGTPRSPSPGQLRARVGRDDEGRDRRADQHARAVVCWFDPHTDPHKGRFRGYSLTLADSRKPLSTRAFGVSAKAGEGVKLDWGQVVAGSILSARQKISSDVRFCWSRTSTIVPVATRWGPERPM